MTPTVPPPAQPFFFGPAGTTLFGWYHAAAPAHARPHGAHQTGRQTERPCAVLLCPPAGHEYMYSYRAFRQLALCLAAAGFPVLRFDYYGTGNAEGDPHGPAQVAGWEESIRIAAGELRRRSGRDAIVMVGLRLGATLAQVVAAQHPVAALVSWDPCVMGTSYVREIKMLATASGELPGSSVVDQASGDIEALGFALTPGMVADISAIDLTRVAGLPAPRVLLLHRVGSAAQERLAARLRAAGAQVTETPYTDHETFMVAAIRSRLPDAALRDIQHWLESAFPADGGVRIAAAPAAPFATRLPLATPVPVVEDAVQFASALFGVVTAPAHPPADMRDAPAVVFLNTGADHHIGPRRMYVHLARCLAQSGFTVFRFDLAGLGDSAARPGEDDNVSYPSSANDDVRAAIDLLATRGVARAVLVGMCSGGYHAVHLSSGHPDVAGMIAINPALYWNEGDPTDIAYFEERAQARPLTREALSPNQWRRLARGDLSPARALRAVARRGRGALRRAVARGTGALSRHESPVDRFARLLPPRLDVHFVFAGNDLGLHYLRTDLRPLFTALEARPNFTLSVIEGAGHVFIPLQGQATLRETIITWLSQRYAPPGRAAARRERRAHFVTPH